jgi:hypothetical protein
MLSYLLPLRTLLRLAWFLGVAVVIVGSLLPGDSAAIRALDKLDISDKIQHFAAYMVVALLPALHERRPVVVTLAVALVGLGVLLEFGQVLSPGRDFEIGDMVADTAGVCVGIAAGWPLRRHVGRYTRH